MARYRCFQIVFFICVIGPVVPGSAFAYLDPGSGSYFFQVLIAAFVGALFTAKVFWQKIKSFCINFFSRKQTP